MLTGQTLEAFLKASDSMHADTEWAVAQYTNYLDSSLERLEAENKRLRERVRELEDRLLLMGDWRVA